MPLGSVFTDKREMECKRLRAMDTYTKARSHGMKMEVEIKAKVERPE